MPSLQEDFASGIFARSGAPCISLYQPTHRSFPDRKQDPIRFRNLLKEVEASLRRGYSREQAEELLGPLARLADDSALWESTLDGLAVLAAPGLFRLYRLQRTVPERAIVADTFHIKPLLRIVQSADRYQLLALTREDVALYEGDRDALDEVALAPEVPRTLTEALGEDVTEPQQRVSSYAGGQKAPLWHGYGDSKDEAQTDAERWFRAVDRAITEKHSNPSRLPLLLVALAENQARFRRLSRNPQLMEEGVDADPKALSRDELRERAWKVLEPRYLSRLETLVERFRESHGTGLGTDDPEQAAAAAVAGRIDTLLVEAERELPGKVREDGTVEWNELADPAVDDLLDDVAVLTLERGGEVVVVPAARMPTGTGLAATFRY